MYCGTEYVDSGLKCKSIVFILLWGRRVWKSIFETIKSESQRVKKHPKSFIRSFFFLAPFFLVWWTKYLHFCFVPKIDFCLVTIVSFLIFHYLVGLFLLTWRSWEQKYKKKCSRHSVFFLLSFLSSVVFLLFCCLWAEIIEFMRFMVRRGVISAHFVFVIFCFVYFVGNLYSFYGCISLNHFVKTSMHVLRVFRVTSTMPQTW